MEFAIVVPLFFLLVFAIIDLGRYYFVKVTIENAVRQAGRYAVTGQSMTNLTRVASIKKVAQNAAPGLDLTQILISSTLGGSNQAGTSTSNNLAAAGGPGDSVTISLTTNLKLFTNLIGRYYGTNDTSTFTETVTFRNEDFPSSQTD